MKLVIRGVGTGGHPNLRKWEPTDPTTVSAFVLVAIGPRERKGADDFVIQVATPSGLALQEPKNGIIATRPLLVMHRYDFDVLWRWLQTTVANCEAETWTECVANLRRYFQWEYENDARRQQLPI